jgi:hypothetical protein
MLLGYLRELWMDCQVYGFHTQTMEWCGTAPRFLSFIHDSASAIMGESYEYGEGV